MAFSKNLLKYFINKNKIWENIRAKVRKDIIFSRLCFLSIKKYEPFSTTCIYHHDGLTSVKPQAKEISHI